MPTVIDSLVVTLGLDPKNFTDEQKKALEAFNKSQDAIDRRLKGLEERNKKSAQSFGDATHAAEGLFTVLAGSSLVAFARDTVTTAASAGRMATNIGIATNELSAFGRMIERNGGNAEAAAGSMKGFVDQMQRAKWGQTSPDFLLGLSQVGAKIEDSPIAVFMKLARFAEKNSVQDVNLAGQRLGLSQDIINAALKGSTKALADYRKAAAGAISPEQIKALTDLQGAWVALDQSIRTVGTDITAGAAPALTRAASAVSEWVEANRNAAGVLGTILTAMTALTALKPAAWVLRLLGFGGAAAAVGAIGGAAASLPGKVIRGGGLPGAALSTMVAMKEDAEHGNKLRTWLREKLGIEDPGEEASWVTTRKAKQAADSPAPAADMSRPFPTRPSEPPAPASVEPPAAAPPTGEPAFRSKAEKEAFIRAEATRLKIEPEVAFKVSKSEGFDNFKSTIPGEQSFGAFQLHVTPGGRGRAVGDQFRERTGLDPSDPSTERAGITFALEWAKQHGWGDFHGAANTGIGKWEGIQKGGSTVTIGELNIKTESKDPREHGRLAADEIKRRVADGSNLAREITTNANSGQRP